MTTPIPARFAPPPSDHLGIAHPRPVCQVCDRAVATAEAPPTDAEIEAHEAADGAWLVTLDWGDGGSPVLDLYSARDVRHYAERSEAKSDDLSCRVTAWRAVDRDGRPCAWPTVTP